MMDVINKLNCLKLTTNNDEELISNKRRINFTQKHQHDENNAN